MAVTYATAKQNSVGGAEISGRGWMVGPYVVAQIGEQPLFFEGRLLYGRSDNRISPFGTFIDKFDTERMLALIALEGSYEGERFRYFPRLQISHVSDRQEAYVDGLSNLVPEQTVALTEVAAGVDFEMPLLLGGREHLLTWGLSGIWSQVNGDGAASAFIDDSETGRGRIDVGYSYSNGNGLNASTEVFLDGLGSGAFMTYGLNLGFELEF